MTEEQATEQSEEAAETQWFDGLSDEVKTDENMEVLKDYKTQDEMVDDFFKLRGEIPAIPESKDAYDFEDPPENVEFDDDRMGDFKEFCFDNKIPNETANLLLQKHLADIPKIADIAYETFKENLVEENKAAREACENALKDEWKGDTYNANKEIANKAFHAVCDHLKIDTKGLNEFGNDPNVIKIFHAIGTKMSEDAWHSGRASGTGEKSTAKTLYPTME